ncbi:MAG: beta-ketoacyl synthase N-terminal-like domain-containing protein, partial [Bacteroidota bacterium]
MGMRRVVVTGLGALTPLGNSVQDYWSGLVQGRSGAAPITRFDASKFRTQFAAEVKGFDPENHMDRKEARKMDPYTQYAMVTAEEAFNDAGLHQFKIDGERAGVIWGSGIGGLYTVFHEFKSYFEGDGIPKFNPFFVPKMIS